MDEFKNAIRYQLERSEAKHPAVLLSELLLILYLEGFKDGQHYIEVREE